MTGGLSVEQVFARRDWMISDGHDDGQVEWLASVGADLVRGEGRLTGERTLSVSTPDGSLVELVARRAVIVATGSAPVVPPVPGLAEVAPWSNREATNAKGVPESLIILGGGAVGVEMAQAWFRLGCSSVTVVEAADRLLASVEPFAGELLAAAFGREGIEVRTDARLAAVSREGEGLVRATLADGELAPRRAAPCRHRTRPAHRWIGLESLGLTVGRVLATDDQLHVEGVPGDWLYAIGDVRLKRSLLSLQELMRQIRHYEISDQAGEINIVLRGHYAYYGVAGNLRNFVKVYRAVARYWRSMLCSRSWAGRRLTWDAFNQIKERTPLLKPKLRLPYGKLQALAVL